MSGVATEALKQGMRSIAGGEVENLARGLASDFVGGLGAILEDADSNARAKVQALIEKGFEFKSKAVTAQTTEQARMYAGEVETIQRRVRTILLAEKLVAEESTAALVADLFGRALKGLGDAVSGLVGVLAAGIAKGAIAGLTGGEADAFDASSIFPFA